MARSHGRNRTSDFRIKNKPSSSPPAKLIQGFRDFPPIDPSFLHAARTTSPPWQEVGLEKFSHRFRGPRGFDKFPRRGFRRLREEPTIQLYLLAIASFSQVKLVVNSSWTQQGKVQFFNMVRRHHKQDASGRGKTIQNVQQPRECDAILVWSDLFRAKRRAASLRAARI